MCSDKVRNARTGMWVKISHAPDLVLKLPKKFLHVLRDRIAPRDNVVKDKHASADREQLFERRDNGERKRGRMLRSMRDDFV